MPKIKGKTAIYRFSGSKRIEDFENFLQFVNKTTLKVSDCYLNKIKIFMKNGSSGGTKRYKIIKILLNNKSIPRIIP